MHGAKGAAKALLKTLLMTTEANCLCSGYVLSLLSMAGFDPIMYGRFWVITEVALTATFAAVLCSATHAQSGQRSSQQNLIEQFLPDGAVPKNLNVTPDRCERVIKELKRAQPTAHGQRAQQVAFILAALNVDYVKNRDYLFHVLSGCNYPEIRYDCDGTTGEYLMYLYKHGHAEILAPLLKTSVESYNAAGTESLGAEFGEMIQKSPESFLQAVSTLPVATQKRVCNFAGSGDGVGLGVKGLAQAQRNLHRIRGEVALRCLTQIEVANKPD